MVTVKKCVITLLEALRVSVEQASLCNLMDSHVEVQHMRIKSRILPYKFICRRLAKRISRKRQKTLQTSLDCVASLELKL